MKKAIEELIKKHCEYIEGLTNQKDMDSPQLVADNIKALAVLIEARAQI